MISHLFTGALVALLLAIIVYDARSYIIPNTFNALIVALFIVACMVLPIPMLPALAAATAIFLLGLGLFALGLLGGGDVKLLAALSLWASWPGAGMLLVYTALFGGALVLLILPLRKVVPFVWFRLRPTRNLPTMLTPKAPIPYGLAIAAAFFMMLASHQVPGL